MEYFSELEPGMVKALYKIYELDFLMHNYQVNEYEEAAERGMRERENKKTFRQYWNKIIGSKVTIYFQVCNGFLTYFLSG